MPRALEANIREALARLEQENKFMVGGPKEGLERVMVYKIVDDARAHHQACETDECWMGQTDLHQKYHACQYRQHAPIRKTTYKKTSTREIRRKLENTTASTTTTMTTTTVPRSLLPWLASPTDDASSPCAVFERRM